MPPFTRGEIVYHLSACAGVGVILQLFAGRWSGVCWVVGYLAGFWIAIAVWRYWQR